MKRILLIIFVAFLSLSAFSQPQMVTELPAYSGHYVGLGNKLFFAIDNELWTSDGSINGTQKVTDLGEVITDIQTAGDKLFITTNYSDMKLYISDGTSSGTKAITGSVFSGTPSNYTVFDGKAFFFAYTSTDSFELWSTDGSMAGTSVYKLLSSVLSCNLTIFDNALYFVSEKKLWKITNASNPPTIILEPTDFPENAELNSYGVELGVTIGMVNNRLIFSTYFVDYETQIDIVKIYSTTGEVGNYTALKEIYPALYIVNQAKLKNGEIIFTLYGASSILHPVWVTDGTVAGTQELVADVGLDASTEKLVSVGDKMLLIVRNQQYYSSLITDGTVSGTNYFRSFNSSGFNSLASIDSILFFVDHMVSGDYWSGDGINNRELWQSDLTTNGTHMVRDLTPNPTDKYYGSGNLINIQGVLYFSTGEGYSSFPEGEDCPDTTPRLWKYCEPFFTEVVTSVVHKTEKNLLLYPNPFTNKLNIQNIEGELVSVYNAMGNLVFQQNNSAGLLDLSSLPNGVYTIKVESSTQAYKVVKSN